MTRYLSEETFNALLAFLIERDGGQIVIDSATYDAWALRQHPDGDREAQIVVGRIEERPTDGLRTIILNVVPISEAEA